MVKVIYPITWLAGREGEAADVLHDIAAEMMQHRAELIQHVAEIPEGEAQIYLKQACFLEEYATVLNAIYYQLEPEKWNPEISGEVIELARIHNIALPGWMKAGDPQADEPGNATTQEAENRFTDDGGRISPDKLIDPART
jgi:hypothetical protein